MNRRGFFGTILGFFVAPFAAKAVQRKDFDIAEFRKLTVKNIQKTHCGEVKYRQVLDYIWELRDDYEIWRGFNYKEQGRHYEWQLVTTVPSNVMGFVVYPICEGELNYKIVAYDDNYQIMKIIKMY
jgi:hypothetical protein